MQAAGARFAINWMALRVAAAGLGVVASGCVSHIYQPGAADNPMHQLQLGQTYGDMERVLGKPDRGHTEDLSGGELALLFLPGWNLVEAAADFHPSALQIYTYDRWGTVTVDNDNHIIRIEAK